MTKYTGLFIPTNRYSEIKHVLSNTNVRVRQVIFSDISGEWKYTIVYYKTKQENVSIPNFLKYLLSSDIAIHRSTKIRGLIEWLRNHLIN